MGATLQTCEKLSTGVTESDTYMMQPFSHCATNRNPSVAYSRHYNTTTSIQHHNILKLCVCVQLLLFNPLSAAMMDMLKWSMHLSIWDA